MRFATIVVLGYLGLCSPAFAGVVTGMVGYADREYDHTNGIKGTRRLPVRRAVVCLYRAKPVPGKKLLLGKGVTNDVGFYTFIVPAEGVLSARFVVWAMSDTADPAEHARVAVRNRRGVTHHFDGLPTPIDTSGAPWIRVEIKDPKAAPFNLFDTMIRAVDYIQTLEPGIDTRSKLLEARWPLDEYGLAYGPKANLVVVPKKRAFDDDGILHEVGHWAQHHFSRDDAPFVDKHYATRHYDPRLAFSEGWASYFSSAVRLHEGSTLYPEPSYYVKTNGTKVTLTFELEGPDLLEARQQTNEVAVAAALWDTLDEPTDPGAKAEAFDNVANREQTVWQAVRDLRTLPGNEQTTFDAWFRRWKKRDAANAHNAAGTWSQPFNVDGAFEQVQIRFYTDGPYASSFGWTESEPNDDESQPWAMGCEDFPIDLGLFAADTVDPDRKGDEDWFRVFWEEPFENGSSVTIRVHVLRVLAANWNGKMNDGGDFEIEVTPLSATLYGGTAGATLDDDDGGDGHQDLVQYVESDPDPGDNQPWSPYFTVRVRRSDKSPNVHFGFYRLFVEVDQN